MARIHAAAFTRQRPWAASELAGFLQDRLVRAESRDQGFGLIRVLPPEAELLTLAVHPDAQGQGVGRALLSALCDAAREAGATQLLLEVAAGNAPALSLYQSAGFTTTGTRPGYYRYPDGACDDAVLMVLELPKP